MIKLIDINDIIELKPMSLNTDVTKKLNFCIEEAQKYDVMPFLGDTLYILLETDFSNSPSLGEDIYADLFNGCDYVHGTRTFRHGGIKALLTYYAYSRYVQNSTVNASAFGLVEKINDHSNGVSKETLSRQIANATALAEAEKTKVDQFIRYNISDYPTWCYAGKTTAAPSGIKINAIGGSRIKMGSSYRCRGCGHYRCLCNFI
ncbi:MAG: hypothetical protein V4549_17920 [Bacteroidota bacterium]